MSFDPSKIEATGELTIPVAVGNSAPVLYECPIGQLNRPIVLSLDQQFTGGTIDEIWISTFPPNIRSTHYIVDPAAKNDPFVLFLGHLDLWLQERWSIWCAVTGCTVAGAIGFAMIYERTVAQSRPTKPMRLVQIVDSVELPTKPRLWPPW